MILESINNLVENEIKISTKKKYVAIIGRNPSKGARSPKLWNAAFKKHKIDMLMYPLDVKKENLNKLIKKLDDDINFLGGSVAVPYKEDIFKILRKKIDRISNKIGSVNCLYRDKKTKKIFGFNTDGYGALECLKDNISNLQKRNIIIFGLGGAGKSVVAVLENYVKKKIIVYVRNLNKHKNYSRNFKFILKKFPIEIDDLESCDVLINTTTVGSLDNNKTIINEGLVKKLKKDCFVFDIIYQPLKTELINISKKSNLKTVNGIFMNLEQAVIAFHKTISFIKNKKITRLAMSNE